MTYHGGGEVSQAELGTVLGTATPSRGKDDERCSRPRRDRDLPSRVSRRHQRRAGDCGLGAAGPGAAARTGRSPPCRERTSASRSTARHKVEVEDRWTLAELLRDQLQSDRHQDRMRARRVRRLHRAPGRRAGVLLQPARGLGRRADASLTVEGLARERRAASAAAGVHRARRAAVRLLHVGPADGARRRSWIATRTRRRRTCARRWPATSAAAPTTTATSRRWWRSAPAGRHPPTAGPEVRREPADRSAGRLRRDAADDGRPCHAAHRRRRARHRARDVHARRASCRACSTRASCAARIRTRASASIDVSKARALPGVKAVLTHENCQVVWGAGSIAGGQQYNDEIKKITKQRRYAFNNPVRFVGEPVAAVAAVDRHVAEEALALIAVDYEALPFVLDQEGGAEAGRAADLAGGQPLAEQPQRGAADRRSGAATWQAAFKHVGPRLRGPLHDGVRPQRADGAARLRGALGRRQADGLHADRRHRQLPSRHGARSRHPGREGPRRLRVHGRQLRQQEPEPGRRSDHRDAGQGSRRAGEAGVLAQGRLHRHARPLADGAVLQGRRRRPTARSPRFSCAASAAWGRTARTPARSAASSSTSARTSRVSISPVYTNRTVSGNFRGPEYPQGFFGIQSMMDDVAYRLKMDPVDFVAEEHDADVARRGARTPTTRSRSASGAAPRRSTGRRAGSRSRARTPGRSSAAPAWPSCRSAPGSATSSAVIRLDANGDYTLYVGVTDVGAGAKTTMGADRGRGAGRAAVDRSTSSGATPIAVRTRSASPAAARRS